MITYNVSQKNVLQSVILIAITLYSAAICLGAPSQPSNSFQCSGYITTVDPDHQKITYTSSGTTYLIDTKQAQIHLLKNLATPPEIGDLVVGMRVQVNGSLIDGKFVHADAVQVLPYVPPTDAAVTANKASGAEADQNTTLSGVIVAKNTFANTMIVRTDTQVQLIVFSKLTMFEDGTGQHLEVTSINNGDIVKVTGLTTGSGTVTADDIVLQPAAVVSSN